MELGSVASNGPCEPVDAAELAASGAAGSTVVPVGQLAERLVAGFLLGYHGHTHAAYRADLRDFTAWCASVRTAPHWCRLAEGQHNIVGDFLRHPAQVSPRGSPELRKPGRGGRHGKLHVAPLPGTSRAPTHLRGAS
jgi:hypothetical protein